MRAPAVVVGNEQARADLWRISRWGQSWLVRESAIGPDGGNIHHATGEGANCVLEASSLLIWRV
jgi:hypothetical protein